MIQFILGKSGTGKTARCIEEIITELLNGGNRKLIYLVPEQATYQAERAIINDVRIIGYNRLSILSFQRLAFLLSEKNTSTPPLSTSAKQMIISRILMENSEKLKVFKLSSQQSASASAAAISATITELQQYSKGIEDVESVIEKLSTDPSAEISRLKFSDIKLIYSQYLKFIEGVYINHDNQLNIACQSVAAADFLKGALLWVDGFSGFTSSELRMLREMIKVCLRCRIALCLDAARIDTDYPDISKPDITSFFGPTERTYSELVSLSRSVKTVIESPLILKETFRFNSPALGHIEKYIFSQSPFEKLDSHASVEITASSSRRVEIEYVAREICRLVRSCGYRWRDIAVVASDIESYRHYITAIFGDYGIPIFLDSRKDLRQYPAMELITSALKVAVAEFSTADVFAYLKSGLVPVSSREVDLLENYCLAFGICANDWLSDSQWRFAPSRDTDFDQAQINAIRRSACEDLFSFRASVREISDSAGGFVTALLRFLEKLKLLKTLEIRTNEARQSGDNEQALIHQQFVVGLSALLEEFTDIFGDLPMTFSQCASIITAALSQMTLALIPPCLDQVLIGSIERSRHPDLKAVFLIGTCQKLFPVPVSYDSILSEKDRLAAESFDFRLSDTAARKLIDRRYLAYIAFTRPSEHLFISYPLTDQKGSDVQPSAFLDDLKSLFSDFQEKMYYGPGEDDEIYSRKELRQLLCENLGSDGCTSEAKPQLRRLLSQMSQDDQMSLCAAFVQHSLDYDNSPELEKDFSDKFFADTLHTSATRLDTFAACPYKYFSANILKLKPRRRFELKPLDLGKFYHSCLESLFRTIEQSGRSFYDCSDEELISALEDSIESLKSEDDFLRSFIGRSIHNRVVVESASAMLRSALYEIVAIGRAGSFTQVAAELRFGMDSDFPPCVLDIDEKRKVVIHGSIDRVDIASVAGRNYALVFDYKMSEKSFDYSLLSRGLGMQLLIYCLALRGKSLSGFDNIQPIGAFYLPIQSSPQRQELGRGDTRKIIRKPRGFFDGSCYQLIDNNISGGNSQFYRFSVSAKDKLPYNDYERRSALRPEHFESIFNLAQAKIRSIAADIFSGRISLSPYRSGSYTPCGHCAYKTFCRFDWQINSYREIPAVTKTQLLSGAEEDE